MLEIAFKTMLRATLAAHHAAHHALVHALCVLIYEHDLRTNECYMCDEVARMSKPGATLENY